MYQTEFDQILDECAQSCKLIIKTSETIIHEKFFRGSSFLFRNYQDCQMLV